MILKLLPPKGKVYFFITCIWTCLVNCFSQWCTAEMSAPILTLSLKWLWHVCLLLGSCIHHKKDPRPPARGLSAPLKGAKASWPTASQSPEGVPSDQHKADHRGIRKHQSDKTKRTSRLSSAQISDLLNWELRNNGCFKPLSFEVVCYIAILKSLKNPGTIPPQDSKL